MKPTEAQILHVAKVLEKIPVIVWETLTREHAIEVAETTIQAYTEISADNFRNEYLHLKEAHDRAGKVPFGTMNHDTQWLPFANLYNATENFIDKFEITRTIHTKH